METKAKITRVEEMPVFRIFYELALAVEKAGRGFGPDFRWLRGQALRSSESVCANMTEGFYSQYSTEYLQSLHRCRREARETMTHLDYARDVGLLPAATARDLLAQYEAGLEQLSRLVAGIERKIQESGKTKPGWVVKEEATEYEA
jgi:four helix bundle protein